MKKQDKVTQSRMKEAIGRLPLGDVKRIQGKDYELYRLRIGNFRITFTREVNTDASGNAIETLYIEEINNRGDIYKNL